MSGAALLPDDPHDRVLRAAVAPPDWENPMPAARYDLVVLGAGTAGLVCAAGAAGLGARVALVERALMGGDCLVTGCVPSKALLRAARAAADVRDAARFGVHADETPRVDFAAATERLRRVRADLAPHDGAARFRGLGVDVFLGSGRFTGRDVLHVSGFAGDRELRFARAVVATGARPALPPIPGLQQAGFLTSETVFALPALPPRLAVLGGGPIGCELAQAFARLGSRVTLVQRGPRLLPRDDAQAADVVRAALQADGVEVLTGAVAVRVGREGAVRMLDVELGGAARRLSAEEVLVATGRAPVVEGLGLEAAGVEADARLGVHVDDRLRTSNPRIYAAGDVGSTPKFTHVADATARLVLRNALFGGRARASALLIPWTTYTDPELAQVGPTEADATARGLDVEALVQPLAGVDRAVIDGDTRGFLKLLVQRGSGQIVGATLVARHAGEILPVLTLAIATRTRLGTLSGLICSYPTEAEAVKRLADGWNRRRVTPLVRSLVSRWLALRR